VSRTFRILAVAVVAVLAVGGYWKFALGPKRERAAELQQQVAAAEAELAQTQQLIKTYEDAKAEYKANYATVVRLGKAVPADDDTRSLVVQLDAAAKRSGIDFDNIDISTGAAAATAGAAEASGPVTPGAVSFGSFSAMPLNLAFTGEFGSLASFLARLERFVSVKDEEIAVNGRLVRVDGLNLKPAEGGWPGLQVEIAASSYIVPTGESLTAGATASAPAGATTPPSTEAASTTTSSGSDIR